MANEDVKLTNMMFAFVSGRNQRNVVVNIEIDIANKKAKSLGFNIMVCNTMLLHRKYEITKILLLIRTHHITILLNLI